jgi:predicted nucleic acid-binding protein
MIRMAIDSNVLIDAEFKPDPEKGMRASELILRTVRNGVIAAQVLGEFLRFVQRRAPDSFEDAMRQVTLYQSVFLTPPTTDALVNKAFELARTHRMQFWDSVVCAASAAVGARVLLTEEDMQDGRSIDGLRLLNPFPAAQCRSGRRVAG